MKIIKYEDLNRLFTSKLMELITAGGIFNGQTVSGGDGTEMRMDVFTKDSHLVRVMIDRGRMREDEGLKFGLTKEDFKERFSIETMDFYILDFGVVSKNPKERNWKTYWSRPESNDCCTVLKHKIFLSIDDRGTYVDNIADYKEWWAINKARRNARWNREKLLNGNDNHSYQMALTKKSKELALKLKKGIRRFATFNIVKKITFCRAEWWEEDEKYGSHKKGDLRWAPYIRITYSNGKTDKQQSFHF